jgi:AcrR family transcriptional regulator
VSEPGGSGRGPGRPARLTRELVLDAAEELLDREGAGAVTIRAVAEALGVSPMALYRHVGDKDDLLLALVDRLAQRLPRPTLPDDPRERLLVLWVLLYEALAEHSWLPEVLARRRLMAPSVLWAVEAIHAAFRAAGLELQDAVLAYRLCWQFTLGALLVRAGLAAPSVQEQLRGAPDPERFPTLAAAAAGWRAAHGRDTYRADIAALVDRLLE